MNRNNSNLIVGVFVSIGVIALVAIVLVLAGERASESTARFTVLFERDISGLTVGAPARYLGVEVGRVIDMRLVTGTSTRVRVDLEVLESTPVTTATFASLAFQGVTGVAFISLAPDQAFAAQPLLAGEFEYPVIPARNTGLAALLSDGPEITQKISALLEKANRLLNETNRDSLGRTLANIETLTGALAAEEKTIGELPAQIRRLLTRFDRTASEIQSTISAAGPELASALQAIDQTSENLARISSRVDYWLSVHDPDIQDFMDGGLAKLPLLIVDAREAMRELEKLLIELRESKSQFLYKPTTDAIELEH